MDLTLVILLGSGVDRKVICNDSIISETVSSGFCSLFVFFFPSDFILDLQGFMEAVEGE